MILRPLFHREYVGGSGSMRRSMVPGLADRGNEEHLCRSKLIQRFRERSSRGTSNDDYLPTVVKFPCGKSWSRESGSVVAVGDEFGSVSLYDADSNLLCQEVVHQNAVFDMTWLHGDRKIATGAGDRLVRLMDAETRQVVASFGKHRSSVRCVRGFNRNENLLVSCCRGGLVCLWDCRSRSASSVCQPEQQLDGLHFSAGRRAGKAASSNVTCVLPTKDDVLLATSGANDGMVKFWDLRLPQGRRRFPQEVMAIEARHDATQGRVHPGISSLSFSPDGSRVLVNYLLGDIVEYDWINYTPSKIRERSKVYMASVEFPFVCSSFYIESCYSPQGDFIVSASGDGALYLWDTQTHNKVEEPMLRLEGHQAEVGGVDWDPCNLENIASIADDGSLTFWQIDTFGTTQRQEQGEQSQGLREEDEFPLTPFYLDSPLIQSPRGLNLWTPNRVLGGDERISVFHQQDSFLTSKEELDEGEEGLEESLKENRSPNRQTEGEVKRARALTLLDYWHCKTSSASNSACKKPKLH